jgi:hypothetical protein
MALPTKIVQIDGHRLEVANINNQISKVMDLVVKLVNPNPALKKINELEAQRKTLEDQIACPWRIRN